MIDESEKELQPPANDDSSTKPGEDFKEQSSISKTSSSGSDLSGSAQSSESTSPTLLNGKNANTAAEPAPPKRHPTLEPGNNNSNNMNGLSHKINIQQELKSKLIGKKENRIAAPPFGADSTMDENTLANQHHQFTNQMILYFKQQQQLQQQQQQQQHQMVHQPKPVGGGGGAKLPLAQSVSVPRLHGQSTKPYDVAHNHNAHHFNSHHVPNADMHAPFSKDVMSSTATFLPPTMSNHASLEVKQKLKNAILQKLDRDKTNHL